MQKISSLICSLLLLPALSYADTPRPSEATAPAKEASTSANSVILRLGSFNNQNLAERQLAQLAILGVQAKIDNFDINDQPIYRINSGKLSREEALKIQELLKSYDINSYMIPAPSSLPAR